MVAPPVKKRKASVGTAAANSAAAKAKTTAVVEDIEGSPQFTPEVAKQVRDRCHVHLWPHACMRRSWPACTVSDLQL